MGRVVAAAVAVVALASCGYGSWPNVTNHECRTFDIEAVMERLDVDQDRAIEILDHWRCR